jgi:hypothetical protein
VPGLRPDLMTCCLIFTTRSLLSGASKHRFILCCFGKACSHVPH